LVGGAGRTIIRENREAFAARLAMAAAIPRKTPDVVRIAFATPQLHFTRNGRSGAGGFAVLLSEFLLPVAHRLVCMFRTHQARAAPCFFPWDPPLSAADYSLTRGRAEHRRGGGNAIL